jgi:hypothetical protein
MHRSLGRVELTFTGEIFGWRGPAPYQFVAVPPGECAVLRELSGRVSYGWGMIPVTVATGATTWTTSLWPKDGGYVVPMKTAARRSENLDEGDIVTLVLTVADD